MQTLQDFRPSSSSGRSRGRILRLMSAAFAGLLLTPALAACSNPTPIKVSVQEPGGLRTSTCETAYSRASTREHLDMGPFGIATAESYEETAQSWIDAAVECPSRRDEAAVYAARAHMRAWHVQSGEAAGAKPSTSLAISSSDNLDTAAATMGKEAATQAAKGEDMAGFAMSILAARHAGAEWMLSLSDAHTTAGQILVSHLEADPRPGTYSVQELLTHPDTIIDKANGLRSPTTALVEMNAARSILASIDAMSKTTSGTGKHQEGSADEAARNHRKAVRELTDLAVSHIYLSLAFGYPNTKTAIFAPLSAS